MVLLTQIGSSRDRLDRERDSDSGISNGLEASKIWQVYSKMHLTLVTRRTHPPSSFFPSLTPLPLPPPTGEV